MSLGSIVKFLASSSGQVGVALEALRLSPLETSQLQLQLRFASASQASTTSTSTCREDIIYSSAAQHNLGERGRFSTMAMKEVGFLGLGIMGSAMASNLLTKGIPVCVWNRSPDKTEMLVAKGASAAKCPAEVVTKCGITFAMLADPAVALSVAFGPEGVLEAITSGKAYVDMSTVDVETSTKISKAITQKGGRFLEAPVSGSKGPAIVGALVILSAGDKSLYDEVTPAFNAMGKKSFYLGEAGHGARMKLVVNMIMGSMMTAFSEGLSLADKAGLNQKDLLDVLDLGAIANGMFKLKGPSMIKGEFSPAFPLKHQQKDMRLALALGDELAQTMPVAAAANELYKKARSLGLGDEDFSAVHNTIS